MNNIVTRLPKQTECLVICILVGTVIVLIAIAYFLFQNDLQSQRSEYALQIEEAIVRDCDITVDVNPEAISMDDILYWVDHHVPLSEEVNMAIECVSPRQNQWRCSCESTP